MIRITFWGRGAAAAERRARSRGALTALLVAVAIGGAAVGCYPNPDDLRGGSHGGAGRSASSGAAGSSVGGPGAGGRGGTGGATTGAAGGNASGSGGRGGTGGPGAAGGSGSGTAGGTGTTVALDASLAKWAAAYCTRQQLCAPSISQYTWGGDSAACNTRFKLLLKNYYGTYADVGVTDATATQCATAISQETCADYQNGKSLPGCFVPGKRANGQPCDVADQCTSLRCSNNASTCGVCAPSVAAGGACVKSGDCVPPLICGQAGTCIALLQMGASCAIEPLACTYALRCRGGICSPPLAQAGAACVEAQDCDTDHGFICDTTAQKCMPFTSSLTTCGVGTTWTLCAKGGFCSGAACTAAAADGKTCNDDLGPFCLSPAVCSTSNLCSLSYRVDCTAAKSAALTFTEDAPALATFPEPPLDGRAFERSLPRLGGDLAP